MTRPLRHDQATLEDLLDHAAWMRGLARRLLADFDDADDVVQETWLSALRTPPGRGATLRPWIATVMRNLVRSRIRHDTRARTREAHFETEAVVPSPETSIVERETERRLAALVLGLAEPYRGTILRRYHDGQSAADIARDEGIPEGTVRWRLKHALDELRAQLTDEDALDRKALAALLPLPVPTWSPDFSGALSGLWHWLTQTAVAKATVGLTAAGAVTAVAAAVVVVQAPLPPSARLQPSKPVAHVVAAAARSADPASSIGLPAAPPPVLPLTTDLPEASGVTVRPAPVHATTQAARAAGAPPVIVGVVRDSRGEPAAHVPVTLRTAGGSGAAERTTKTDEAGRFRLPLRAHTRFVVTAELRGEPAARIEVDVPNRSAIRVEVDADAVDAATIEVELDSPGRRTLALLAKAGRSANQPLSRWCCRQAYLDRDTVHGRGCLKFDEGRRDDGAGPDQDPGLTGCELYGLKAQVSCHHFTRGGLSTGDLSRTEQLACDGRLM